MITNHSLLFNATFFHLLSEKRPELRGGYMLCFLDDGIGMDPSKFTSPRNSLVISSFVFVICGKKVLNTFFW